MTETGRTPHLRGRRGGHHGGTINNYVKANGDRFLAELFMLLRQPSISTRAEG